MFDPVDPRQSFPALELGILKYWKEEDIFKRSLHLRTKSMGGGDPLNGQGKSADTDEFSFYDGPPFATGLPHYGHLLAGTIKDVIPRYQTMQGKRVQRRFGWDCHGLPVEYEIEKEHGINSRAQIEEMGVRAFNALCRSAVQRYAKEWRVTVERMGRFVDMDWDYRTMDPDYMESIWWVFEQLYKKKLIYEGHKPMHICPRCQTPLSNFEVTQGYKDITDQTAYVMFKITEEETYVLAWTTTPWTLPGNLFLAMGPKVHYALVASEGKNFILAKDRVETVFGDRPHETLKEWKGAGEFLGKHYEPLFPYFVEKYKKHDVFRIVEGDFVTTEDGTGIVHIAPGFGEDDYQVGKREGVPLLQHVGMDGKFIHDVTDFAGMDVKPKDDPSKTDRVVIALLEKNGTLFKAEKYKHSYPHCWRCDSPLLNYATSSWFVAVESIKEDMLAANARTEWVPSHIRDGRFGRWLEGARDWAISRNRYWGTPLPIWRCKETGDIEVVGSREALMQKRPDRFTRITVLRHGESEGNVKPMYQGKLPGTNLTERGVSQAMHAGEWLSSETVTRIYASPLARTQQTAKAIAEKTGAEMVTDDRLREVEFGEFEGKTVDFTDLAFVKARRAHKLESDQVESIYHFPGMETWSSVSLRTGDFLQEILPRHRGEHIVIVTHADPLLTIKHFFNKEDPRKLTHQPYPTFAQPFSFFWDHMQNQEMDLHKESIDNITWPGSKHASTVHATFVRHGETTWNKEKRIQGNTHDVALNDTGMEQAKAAAATLKKNTFDAIVSSPLLRTKQTAEIISKELGLPILEWEELGERDLGAWKGQLRSDIEAELTHTTPHGSVAMHHGTPMEGESLSDFIGRAERACDRLRKEFAGKKVLVVTHGGMIQALRVVLEGLSIPQAKAELSGNTAILSLPIHPLFRRIPDVLDCWFESGSMPYAQSHFPFEVPLWTPGIESTSAKKKKLPNGFPADFIAEGIDQTRGWFYTLMVLSSALFKKPAFEHCIVNGTVLAEDGKKMSKRLKNYPEPLVVVEKHGADAVRFALMSSPAVRGEDLRFSEKVVEEIVRAVILPLWNTYSFFVTYANAAKWEPVGNRRASRHPLDTWIKAEVQDLVNRMTCELDAYDLSATCNELHDTIDALTNWYVRLSRRRFAGKSAMQSDAASDTAAIDHEEEQSDALATLYDVLLTLTQVLAPFCPFLTDAMYLNLVAEKHGSVHLTDWPTTKKLKKAETTLLRKTRVLRTIVSLGLKIRSDRKIKVRQPLAHITVALPPSLLEDATLSPQELQLLRDELNVKAVEMVDDPGSIAEVFVQVNARVAGPRLGGRVQDIIRAGKEGEFSVQDDGSILILDERLQPEEATLLYRGREGEDVAADRGIVVSLDTRISDALALEGSARDLIRAIQQLRKDSGLQMQDRITLSIEGADDILAAHGDLVMQETGATFGSIEGEMKEVTIEEKTVRVGFMKI